MKREQLKRSDAMLAESRGLSLAVPVLHVPSSLDRGEGLAPDVRVQSVRIGVGK